MLKKGWINNPDYVALWVYCLLRANHKEKEAFLDSRTKLIKTGSFVTSRLQIRKDTGIQESKVERILECFETEQQIEQQTFTKYRIISILNWDKYQNGEHQNEQQMNNKRTTSEQQVNTNKNDKNDKNVKNKYFVPPTFEEVLAYCQERGNDVNPEKWLSYYQSNGWKVGKNPMKNWQAAIRTWEKNAETVPKQEILIPPWTTEELAKISKSNLNAFKIETNE